MDAGCYEGGNPGIPGDITGTVGRVVVVGAGIAGLAAANALTHAGVECVVLEARDRAGGRLHTVDVAGWRVDMGGSWMRLRFAGEHTQGARLVYADGAFCSGIREAKRLLRSPTVQLRFSPPEPIGSAPKWPCRGGERDAG